MPPPRAMRVRDRAAARARPRLPRTSASSGVSMPCFVRLLRGDLLPSASTEAHGYFTSAPSVAQLRSSPCDDSGPCARSRDATLPRCPRTEQVVSLAVCERGEPRVLAMAREQLADRDLADVAERRIAHVVREARRGDAVADVARFEALGSAFCSRCPTSVPSERPTVATSRLCVSREWMWSSSGSGNTCVLPARRRKCGE